MRDATIDAKAALQPRTQRWWVGSEKVLGDARTGEADVDAQNYSGPSVAHGWLHCRSALGISLHCGSSL